MASHAPGWSAAALADVSEVVEQLHESIIKMENFQKLLELKKDLLGVDNLVAPGRVSLIKDEDFKWISDGISLMLSLMLLQNVPLMKVFSSLRSSSGSVASANCLEKAFSKECFSW